MNLFRPQIAAALAATISLAACVAPPAAPTIPVAPGPYKTLDRFGADQAAASNTLLRKYLPRWPPLTIRQSAPRYWVQPSERGLVPGSARPQATLARGPRLAWPLAALSVSSATRMAPLLRRRRCSSNTRSCMGSAWPLRATLWPASPLRAPRPIPEAPHLIRATFRLRRAGDAVALEPIEHAFHALFVGPPDRRIHQRETADPVPSRLHGGPSVQKEIPRIRHDFGR